MTLQVGMQFPAGSFAHVANNGYGGMATLVFQQDEFLSFTASVGYNYWGPYSAWYLGPSDSYSDFQVLVGIRYDINQNATHPYFGLDLGMNSLDFSRNSSYGAATSNIYEISSLRFGVAPMFGVIIRANQNLNFDINFKYNSASPEQINGIALPATFFGLNLGLQFKL